MKIRICKQCGNSFEAENNKSTRRMCDSCQKDRTKEIICRDCGKEITVSLYSKKILCNECVIKSQNNHFKLTKEQKIICPKCNKVITTVIKKGSKPKDFMYGSMCVSCKDYYDKIGFKEIYNKSYTPPILEDKTRTAKCFSCGKEKQEIIKDTYQAKDIRFYTCKECRSKSKKESYKKMSNLMKEHNPMFNNDSVIKMKDTLRSRIESGDIIYKKGKDHWLYKGNRCFGSQVRGYLYKLWTYPILERDNFTCTKCGETKNLQVHHVKPLRDICKEVFERNNLEYINAYFIREENELLFDSLVSQVLDEHRLEYGITLCKKCHSEIDSYYRV